MGTDTARIIHADLRGAEADPLAADALLAQLKRQVYLVGGSF
jgi:hypothetical protein